MKNIEKYPNTMDALDAYAAYRKDGIGGVSFDIWLEHEYVEPREPTLLEAAEDVLRVWDKRYEYGNLEYVKDRLRSLSVTVKREKRKPVRNCDRYRTAKEANIAFLSLRRSGKIHCKDCTFSADPNQCFSCKLNWLYAETEKESNR